MGPLSCHLDESKASLVCPIQSIVAIPVDADEHRLILQGILSCPVPSIRASTSSQSTASTISEQCSCEGIVPSSILSVSAVDETDREIEKGPPADNNDNNYFSMCRCLVCEASHQETTFAWECDHPMVHGCWGFDCQGLCQTGPLSSLLAQSTHDHYPDYWLDDTSMLEPFPSNHFPDSLRSPSPGSPRAPSPSKSGLPSTTTSGPPSAALVAQSASLLWIMSFLAVTHNSTDFWSSSAATSRFI